VTPPPRFDDLPHARASRRRLPCPSRDKTTIACAAGNQDTDNRHTSTRTETKPASHCTRLVRPGIPPPPTLPLHLHPYPYALLVRPGAASTLQFRRTGTSTMCMMVCARLTPRASPERYHVARHARDPRRPVLRVRGSCHPPATEIEVGGVCRPPKPKSRRMQKREQRIPSSEKLPNAENRRENAENRRKLKRGRQKNSSIKARRSGSALPSNVPRIIPSIRIRDCGRSENHELRESGRAARE
jgi:hypothetical protein